MSTARPLSESDKALAKLLAQPREVVETPQETVLRELRSHLSRGELAEAQQLATSLRTTTSYPSALLAIAEAQHARGDNEAAQQTLRTLQQQVQQWGEGDSRTGYPRAYYLLEVVQAQLRVGDVAGATQTAQLITIAEYWQRAEQALAQGQNGG